MQTTPNCSSLFPPSSFNTHVAMRTSECLADIFAWTTAHHLKLNLSRTEFFFNLGRTCQSLSQKCHSIAFIDCEESGRNPQRWTILHPQHQCCGPIMQICPLQHPQELVFPNNGHNRTPSPSAATCSWLDTQPLRQNCCSMSRKLQCALFSIYQHFSHVTPLLCDFHWLTVAARIRFKMMVLAFKAINGTAPIYLQTLVKAHVPAWALRPTTSIGPWYLHCWEQTKVTQERSDFSLFWRLSGWTNSWPMSGQQSHLQSSAKDSRLTFSTTTSTLHSPWIPSTPLPPTLLTVHTRDTLAPW